MDHLQWLPSIVTLAEHNGDWDAYMEAQYGTFSAAFIQSKPTIFNPKRWAMKRHPLSLNKEATFWHVTSEGRTEEDRVPDMRRMERVGWIRPMIDRCRSNNHVCCWPSERRGECRPNIAVPDFSYIVVLEDHDEYIMLWTAFYVERESQRQKFRKQWEEAHKKRA